MATTAYLDRAAPAPGRATPDLVDRLLAHEEAAFAELLRTFRPRMLAVASHVLHRAADAEDALQDSFVNVMRHLPEFKRESSIETWMHRVVVNCALMSLRNRRRRNETVLDSTVRSDVADRCGRAHAPSAHEVLAGEEMREAIRRAVERLPEAQRTVLQMHDVDELELKEIAELLDVGLSTVKSRLHRAHLALQQALPQEDPGSPGTARAGQIHDGGAAWGTTARSTSCDALA